MHVVKKEVTVCCWSVRRRLGFWRISGVEKKDVSARTKKRGHYLWAGPPSHGGAAWGGVHSAVGGGSPMSIACRVWIASISSGGASCMPAMLSVR